MSEYHDYGPLQAYELVWRSGHVETVAAHQVLLPSPFGSFGGDLFENSVRANRLTMHGEFDGHWRLVLDADYAEVASVRCMGDVDAKAS